MTPRHRAVRRTRLRRHSRQPATPASPSQACIQTLLLAGSLQEAGVEPLVRKRRLLEGLCRITDADRALCVVTRTDLQTGRHQILSAATVTMDPPSPRRSGGRSQRSDVSIAPFSPSEPAWNPMTSDGPTMDDFCWLDGLKLAAAVTLWRSPGLSRFGETERSLVALVHQRCDWVYTHDRHLSAFLGGLAGGIDRADELLPLLQAVFAEGDGPPPPRPLTARIPHLFETLDVSSRQQLLDRWATVFTGDHRSGTVV